MPLTDDDIVRACLAQYRVAATDVWGFAWLPETLACLLHSQVAIQPRTVTAIKPTLASDLLIGAIRLLEDADARATVRRCLTDSALRAWWRRWEATDAAERRLAYHLPVDWLLALWEATRTPVTAR
jgi:hypothetical protein